MTVSVVTGSSTGIGQATALRLARDGHTVHGSVRSEASGQALLEAADPAVREELLLTLMGMGIEPLSTDEYYSPPILN